MLSQIAVVTTIAAVLAIWWAGKRLTVIWNRPGLWDAMDLLAAGLAGIAMLVLELALLSYSGASGPALWLVAVRRAVIFAYALGLACWLASIWVEVETTIGEPPGLEPIGSRAWQIHLGWVPFVEEP